MLYTLRIFLLGFNIYKYLIFTQENGIDVQLVFEVDLSALFTKPVCN